MKTDINIDVELDTMLVPTSDSLYSELLSNGCPLSKYGPMTRRETEVFIEQYHLETHPLYVVLVGDNYYAFV